MRSVAKRSFALIALAAMAGLTLTAFRFPQPAAAPRALPARPATQAVAHQAATGRAPLLGVTVTDGRDLNADIKEFGHLSIIHTYYSGLPPSGAWKGLSSANHSAVITCFNAKPAAILNGSADKVLTNFFDTAPTGHPIYWAYIHEPEHAVQHEGLSIAQYKLAWTHIAALAAKAHNASLIPTLILEEYDLKVRDKGIHNWQQYVPPGHIIKVLTWDAYPGVLGDSPQAPAQFLGPAVAASKAAGMPFGFAEFGLHRMAARPKWLNDVGGYLMASGALFGTYFDSSIVSSFRLTTGAEIGAWRTWVQRSDTANGLPTR
jgi:hypothetical protein